MKAGDQRVAAAAPWAHRDRVKLALNGHGVGESIDDVRPNLPQALRQHFDGVEGDQSGFGHRRPRRFGVVASARIWVIALTLASLPPPTNTVAAFRRTVRDETSRSAAISSTGCSSS